MSKKIDFKTVVIGEHTGYGNASRLLVSSLMNANIEFSSRADTKFNFCMPPDYRYGKYTIGYTPWESTEVPKKWIDGLNRVDDLWVTSDFVANVFGDYTSTDIFELPHGIEECWKPFEHKRHDRPFTFLHVGEPAVRKGGDILLRAWHKAFRDRDDVRLIFKCNKYVMSRVKDRSGSIIGSPGMYENVYVTGRIMKQDELYKLYCDSDVMVYPTRGEGFGLIPFEAIGSGLPTILPEEAVASSFAHFAPLRLVKSKQVRSPEDAIHPGLWFDHDVDELVESMLWAISNYDHVSDWSYRSAQKLHDAFSWDAIAGRAVDRMTKTGAI